MASPNPAQAKLNLYSATRNHKDISHFVANNNTERLVDGLGLEASRPEAQALFDTAITLFSDPFSNDDTRTICDIGSRQLHPWVIRPVEITDRSLADFEDHRLQYEKRLEPAPTAVQLLQRRQSR